MSWRPGSPPAAFTASTNSVASPCSSRFMSSVIASTDAICASLAPACSRNAATACVCRSSIASRIASIDSSSGGASSSPSPIVISTLPPSSGGSSGVGGAASSIGASSRGGSHGRPRNTLAMSLPVGRSHAASSAAARRSLRSRSSERGPRPPITSPTTTAIPERRRCRGPNSPMDELRMLEERAQDQHRRRLVDDLAATVAGQPRLDELTVGVDGREPLVDVGHPHAGALCEGRANLPREPRRSILAAIELEREPDDDHVDPLGRDEGRQLGRVGGHGLARQGPHRGREAPFGIRHRDADRLGSNVECQCTPHGPTPGPPYPAGQKPTATLWTARAHGRYPAHTFRTSVMVPRRARMPNRAEILSQGDEVVTGQIADTNAAWLSEQLLGLGFDVVRHTTVGDRQADIVEVLREIASRAQVCVCTGGLGPTEDDLTSGAVAEAFGRPQELDLVALAQMEERWRAFGRVMAPVNRRQALLPRGSERLENRWGTAPGFAFQTDTGGGRNRALFFCLPGVPSEMKGMFTEEVVPRLAARFAVAPGRLVTLRTVGVAESDVQQALEGIVMTEAVLGFRTKLPENHVKLRFPAGASEEVVHRVVTAVL